MSRLAFRVAIAMLLSCISCGVQTSDTYLIEEGPLWSFTAFIESIDGFPYEMTEERKRLVLEGYESLKVGMHKEEALELLGAPDAEFFTYNESQAREFVDSSWCYYLTRAEEELADPSDRAVFLYFTTEDTLYWAMGTNVASLKALGSPVGDR